ncbi:MAG: ribonuclease P protein component [Actinobacteria bacterium]|nr:ribonuclease P protein component [Actinomycetota bacterium]
MLPARHRLRTPSDFAAAVRSRRSGGPRLVVHAQRTQTRAGLPPRVGFVVSKAVGGAVVRNRVKRRLRALMAARLMTLPRGCDVVLRANPGSAHATYAELSADLERQLAAVLRS